MIGVVGEIRVPEEEWLMRFFRVASSEVMHWSKDPKDKVGSLVVSADRRQVSPGYNGFPRGVLDTKQRLRDVEYRRAVTVHAERNALYNAGFDVHGSTLFSTKFPCHVCAGTMIQMGVARLVAPSFDPAGNNAESQRLALELFEEAGLLWVAVEEIKG